MSAPASGSGRPASAPAPGRVLLAPGQTAHASVDAALAPAARCRPVRASGLRVSVPSGAAAARYVRRPLTACSARGAPGQDYLRVQAIQPGAGVA